jgi:hypothetical protein
VCTSACRRSGSLQHSRRRSDEPLSLLTASVQQYNRTNSRARAHDTVACIRSALRQAMPLSGEWFEQVRCVWRAFMQQ